MPCDLLVIDDQNETQEVAAHLTARLLMLLPLRCLLIRLLLRCLLLLLLLLMLLRWEMLLLRLGHLLLLLLLCMLVSHLLLLRVLMLRVLVQQTVQGLRALRLRQLLQTRTLQGGQLGHQLPQQLLLRGVRLRGYNVIVTLATLRLCAWSQFNNSKRG
jgi:hypothetical protein